MSKTVYKIVNEKIINMIEQGHIPWRKTWEGNVQPQNLITKIPYRGVNVWLLSATQFKSPYWLTWKQTEKLGGAVKDDQKKNFEIVVYWNIIKFNDNVDDKEKTVPILKYYRVYNLEQIDLPANIMEKHVDSVSSSVFNSFEKAEEILSNFQEMPEIVNDSTETTYDPLYDKILLENLSNFKSKDHYYYSLFHQIVHSTGNTKRLDRFRPADFDLFGDTKYTKEELVAEMGSTYLCSYSGIAPQSIDATAEYINGWLNVLKPDDGRFIVFAASRAQKAVDYILNNKIEG